MNENINSTGESEKKREPAAKGVTQSIHELNLEGLSRVCNSKYGWFRRIFWGFLWILFLILCFLNFYSSLIRFLHNPTTVDAAYEESATIALPCVTMCPADNQYRNPAVWQPVVDQKGEKISYDNAYDLLKRSNMTIDELWNISRIFMRNESYGMNQIGNSDILNGFRLAQNGVEKSEIFTITGICTTYKPRKEQSCVGLQSGIAIVDSTEWNGSSPDIPKMYSVIFHTEAETAILRYSGPLLIGSYLAFGHNTVAAVRVQEVTFKNLMHNPCISEEMVMQCLAQCFESQLLNATLNRKPCRLPFMMESSGLLSCKTANDFLAMYNAAEVTISNFNRKSCGCSQPCKKRFYREDYYNQIKTNDMFGLYVMVPRCMVERFDEQIRYDISALFSDVGGALGLLLGLSMINIVEIMEILFLKIFFSLER